MTVVVEITRTELDAAGRRHAAGRSRDSAAARRMPALALVREGTSRTEAGLAGLSDRLGGGTRPLLSPEQGPKSPRGSDKGLTLQSTASCAGAVRTWHTRSKPGSVPCWPNAASATCCAVSASDGWWPAPPATTLRRRRLSARLRSPHRRGLARVCPRPEVGTLVAGRGPHEPARHADTRGGRTRIASGCTTRPAILLVLEIRTAVASGAHAVLVIDDAGRRSCWAAIRGRCITPAHAVADYVNDAAEHSSTVNAWHAVRQREKRLDAAKLTLGEPERISHGGTPFRHRRIRPHRADAGKLIGPEPSRISTRAPHNRTLALKNMPACALKTRRSQFMEPGRQKPVGDCGSLATR